MRRIEARLPATWLLATMTVLALWLFRPKGLLSRIDIVVRHQWIIRFAAERLSAGSLRLGFWRLPVCAAPMARLRLPDRPARHWAPC